MRRLRAALALLLTFAVPIRAETTSDPLWTLLSTYVLAPDEKAAAAEGEAADATGLATLQADLLLLSEGFEAFRDESQVRESLVRLEPRMSPELKPFFKDRASSLDAVYRTLAVTDYTWASRFPEPLCEPQAKRRVLLASRDGLFQTESGEASPWLVALLGPQTTGRSAEEALDKASAKTRLSAAEYERRRAHARKLTMALASDKAEGAARAKLYCARAAAFTDLAAHHREHDTAPMLAARAAAAKPEESVFVVVWEGKRAAATLLQTKKGPVLVTDAAVGDSPTLFAYAGRAAPTELKTDVLSRHAGLGLAVLSYPGNARTALSLAASAPAKDDLVTALGHTEPTGLWTKVSGLVTKSGETSFQTDAAISAELTGGPVLDESGEVVGLLVGRPADTVEGSWPVAVPAPVLTRWLDDPQAAFAETRVESIEEAGTAAILNRTSPAPIKTGLGAWNIPAMGPPPPTPRGVCVSGCNIPSAPSRSYSGGSSYSGSGGAEMGQALGQAMAPLVQALVFQGIPALFRGIGSLFKGKGGTKSSPAVAKSASPKKPEPPPPSKCDIAIESAPDSIGVAPVEIVARITCAPDGPPAGHDVSFSVQWDSGPVVSAPVVKTDAGGYARLTITVDNERTKVAKTAVQAEKSHDDLDRYAREIEAEESAAAEPDSGPIETGDGTRILNTEPVKPPVAKAAVGVGIGSAAIRLTTNGRRLRVAVKVIRLARVAQVVGVAGAPGSGGITLGVSLASTILLFSIESRVTKSFEDADDCALKPGESILDRFIDGNRIRSRGYLDVHEGPQLGHTLTKHVRISDDGLRQRFISEPHIPFSSRFTSQDIAEDAIRNAVNSDISAITIWGSKRTKSTHISQLHGGAMSIGATINSSGISRESYNTEVRLRQQEDCRLFISTAFPY